jgi:hypothetical protein
MGTRIGFLDVVISDLLGWKPYGCSRRLGLVKQGAIPDHPFNGTNDTERGIELEPVAAREFAKRYGVLVLEAEPIVHPEFPMLRCHPDGIIPGDESLDGPGAAEIKCPRREAYYKLCDEPSYGCKLQLQYVMGLMRVKWGKLIVLCADNWEMTVFDYTFDPVIFRHITSLAVDFWDRFVSTMCCPSGSIPTIPAARPAPIATRALPGHPCLSASAAVSLLKALNRS